MTATSSGVVAGRVVEVRDHPNANLIRIALVDINIGRLLQIVFGGPPIVTSGSLVPVAPPGSRIGTQSKKMRRRNYRHMSSEGMLCSFAELGWDVNGPDQVAILRNVNPGDSIDHFAGGGWRSHVDPSYFGAKTQSPVAPVLGPFRPAAFYEEAAGPKERVATCVGGGGSLVYDA